jgi:hypothetical protein
MQKLKQIYRDTYAGENVITQLTLSNNEWNPEVEFVPNRVFNTHTSNQAVVIGNGPTVDNFDLANITNHKGGILSENKLQSYACNGRYKTFTPDFLIAINDDTIVELSSSLYVNDNIVYTTGDNVVKYPGKFYLIPQNLPYDAGSLAAYMACFDGHKKVFLLGYDDYLVDASHPNQAFWEMTLLTVVTTYSDVEFVRVMPTVTHSCSDALLSQPNFRQIDYRGFALEADLG